MKKTAVFLMCVILSALFSCCSLPFLTKAPIIDEPPIIGMPTGTPIPQGEGNAVDIATITEKNVLDVTLALERPANYIWINTVTRKYDGFESVYENTVYVRGDRLYFESEKNGDKVSSVYIIGDMAYVIDPYQKRYNSFKTDKNTDPLISVSSIADVVSLSTANISEGSEEIIDSQSCLLLRVFDESLSLDETYTISLTNGLPVEILSDMDGYVYELKTKSVAIDPDIDESIFSLPSFVEE